MRKNIFYILPLLALTACTSNDLTGDDGQEVGNEIRIATGISASAVSTRGDGMINNALASDLEVTFLRLDKTGATPAYPADYTGTDTIHAKISKTDNVMTFVPAEFYQASGECTRLIGWYPRAQKTSSISAWDKATQKVTFSIDGSTDIMFTGLMEGAKAADKRFSTANGNGILFKHVLTQIAVKVYAGTQSDSINWGGIESITITGKGQSLSVSLPLVSATAGTYPTIAASDFTGSADLQLSKTLPATIPSTRAANDTIRGGQDKTKIYGTGNALPLPVTSSEATLAGYAMFAPHSWTASPADDLVLKVKTVNGGTKTASIKQKLEVGKSYAVTLKFIAEEITPTVQISNWVSGGAIAEIEM